MNVISSFYFDIVEDFAIAHKLTVNKSLTWRRENISSAYSHD